MKTTLFLSASTAILLFAAATVSAQAPGPLPPGPLPPAPLPYLPPHVPITVVIDLDAVAKKALNAPPAAPLPPPVGRPPRRPGGLLDRLRQRQPFRKLAAMANQNGRALEALAGISAPVHLGDDRWLSLQVHEVVFQGADLFGLKRVSIRLAVSMTPTVVVSKQRPPIVPPPALKFGKYIPPPPAAGIPVNFVLKLDPPALPRIMPKSLKNQLDKFGVDPAKVQFAQTRDIRGPRMHVSATMTKPLPTKVNVAFTPIIKKNKLTFAQPVCVIPKAKGESTSGIQQTLFSTARKTVSGLIVGKMKSTTVDFLPHLKKLQQLPIGKSGKVRTQVRNVQVRNIAVERGLLVVHVSGQMAREGIVVFAP